MEFLGKKWSDVKLLNTFKLTSGLILEYKLALENYEDFNNLKIEDFSKLEYEWKSLKEEITTTTEKNIVDKSNDILNKYKMLINAIGPDNFYFYNDGSIGYKNN